MYRGLDTIKFAKLDPETGKTLQDPTTVAGIIPNGIPFPEKDDIRQVEGHNLSEDMSKLLRERNIEWELGLRPEQESPGIEKIR
ncbi:hypothetical protein A3A14_01775 [Candidatus Daviesbacteria bacterium RIFCSPLOWO2_01_FULL_43_38]|uniref:Uncharacterized protein n=3 Tax=Candidatus Daviesiibacteriota TaxID=1752718 RepID=A0A1F5K5K8_9BACT|nr:MAG: hypothetical protein UV33_C0029G0004 [Candidatus Daviesbacteria bacterium GW2011_GWA1_42_6]KKS69357.1 MAG: hypothetical protein UV41_C0056G0008 [Candidatus Daviesbacteria bacterium GW2011_GWA2_42_7]OGE20167.1 MAG: hypothetical protein A2874_03285 [Candidatus Daviesbacteria bacterium RIFCSPHIGHO2_01_FULL_43_17]OGE36068.1 MAG: hypothetical protein A3E45_04005 [Candidatus Daviesbacteria bacterium RIFCSPHIGHO2_12_FULL_43_11]OGE63970.1 MAG: hypothetical protein A3A14_01775 [Candidatus Davies